MAYRNSTRLQARGYFGQREFEAFCQNLMADRAWKSAKKRGGVVNLERYGEDEEHARIALSYETTFPAEWNTRTAWTCQRGGTQYYIGLGPDAFRGPTDAMAFQNGALNSASLFTSATALVGAITPFTIRFKIIKPDSDQKGSYWFCGWGVWRFEVRNGNASVYRVTPDWTNALETERNAYLSLDTLTPTQAARADEIEALIYADRKSIDKVGSEGWYDSDHEITFLPDSRGVFAVVVEGTGAANATDVEDTRITRTRATGTVWPASVISIGSNGGAYAWQLGRPQYATSGTFGLGVFDALLGLDSTDIAVTVRGDANGGTASGECVELNVAKWEIVLTLTGTGLTSPVVYSAEAFAQGGARQGSDTVVFDTNDQLPELYIEDIEPTWDEENRRTSVMVTIRNVDGGLIVTSGSNIYPGYEVGTAHGFMHDRLGDVIVNGVTILSKGVITSSTPNNVRTAAASGTGTQYGRGETKNVFNISDWWTLADEILLTKQPVGDGLKLGEYLRQLLLMGGWKTSEITGVSASDGIILPSANLGESPCVQPSCGCSLGDFMRSLLEKYALGWLLTGYTGAWVFAARPTDIKARFTKNGTWGERSAITPLYRIMNSMDLPRDFTDSYNVFTVLGAKDADGNQLSSKWTIWESITYAPSPSYIGRVKPYAPVIDEGLRTQAMCDYVCRSLAMTHGKPGRFCEFTSWWVDGLHPKDYVLIDGVTWEVVRITGGSTKADRMSFACREVV